MNSFKLRLITILVCLTGRHTPADTALGDWGHFMSYTPTAHFNNPDGGAFTITAHVMRWAIPKWNPETITLRLLAPDGKVLIDGPQKLANSTVTLEVKKAVEGVYRLHTKGVNVWFESTLPQSVVWTGDQGTNLHNFNDPISNKQTGKARKRKFYEKHGPVVFQANVPRRWWFWVPPEVTTFTAEALRDQWSMSQREDWGFFIISPRGQRIRALWGQPDNRSHASGKYHQRQRAEVEVEPGAAGRFWCLEVSLGDSHHYSNINIAFDGVPPYLARSPEEWFDPRTGKTPAISVYDDAPYIQGAPLEGNISFQDLHHKMKDPKFAGSERLKQIHARWPHLEHFSPCPSLGDPDGIEILGDAQFALWNPDGRNLAFRIGTYLPRQDAQNPAMAQVTVTGASGQPVLEKSMPMGHIHGTHGKPTDTLKTGKGVAKVAVAGVERWLSFTYPATPLVLIGEGHGEWKRFRFTACAPRNWYFFVPSAVESFSLRFAADLPTDVLQMEVCAPDRVQALLYARQGEQAITVPKGLAGKIWYLRPSIGSATRMITKTGPNCRFQDLSFTLELKGVPAFLSPTWEQWFDPSEPRPIGKRNRLEYRTGP